MPAIYLCLSITSFLVVYNKIRRDVLHPVAILSSIWFFSAGIASLQWGVYQHEWTLSVHAIIISVGICCWFIGFWAIKKTRPTILVDDPINNVYLLTTRLLFVFCFLFVVYIFNKNGMSFNGLQSIEGTDLKTNVGESLTGISSLESYIMNLFPFCAVYSFFELVYGEEGNKHIKYNAFVILIIVYYCLRVIYSRGTLLYLLLGFLFIYNSKKKLSIKVLAGLMVGIVVLLGIIMTVRVFSGSVVYSQVRHIHNPVLSSAYNYIAYSFENFSIIAEEGSRYKIFANVFQSFYKLLGIYKPDQVISNNVVGVFNSLTWLSSFYDDLGVFGTILYPSIISLILSRWYNKSLYNKYYVLLLAVLQKAIFVPFFGNYFLTTMSVMFPYFVTGFICIMCRKTSIACSLPKMKRFKVRIRWR